MGVKCKLMLYTCITILFVQSKYELKAQRNFKTTAKKDIAAIAIPATLVAAGVALEYFGNRSVWWQNKHGIQDRLLNTFQGYTSTIDDYLQHAPIAMVAGLNLSSGKGSPMNTMQFKNLLLAEAISLSTVYGLKYSIGNLRPDGSTKNSFPSGHTAQAFLTARFLDKEYGNQAPWVKWLGYSMATSTGVFRILKNRHWASDVLLGAGIGFLSVDLSYLLARKRKSRRLSVFPIKKQDAYGLALSYRL